MINTEKKIGDKVRIWKSLVKNYPNSDKICSVESEELKGTIIKIHIDISKTDTNISYDILTDKGIFTRIENSTLLIDKRDRNFFKINNKIK